MPASAAPETRSIAAKPTETEEVVDSYVHRPVARVLVSRLVDTAITPDQVTLLSGVCGVMAGVLLFFSAAHPALRALAALLLFASVVLDCADGQLARARGTASTSGATLDGIADYFVGSATMIGLIVAAVALSGEPRVWLLGIAAGVSMGLRSWLFDRIKHRYMWSVGWSEREEDPARVEIALARARADRRWKEIGLLLIYQRYTSAQRAAVSDLDPVDPDRFRAHNRRRMKIWTWLGIGTHFASLYLAAALAVVWPQTLVAYLLYLATLPNALLVTLLALERRAGRGSA